MAGACLCGSFSVGLAGKTQSHELAAFHRNALGLDVSEPRLAYLVLK